MKPAISERILVTPKKPRNAQQQNVPVESRAAGLAKYMLPAAQAKAVEVAKAIKAEGASKEAVLKAAEEAAKVAGGTSA